jgi:hypothetical protein
MEHEVNDATVNNYLWLKQEIVKCDVNVIDTYVLVIK